MMLGHVYILHKTDFVMVSHLLPFSNLSNLAKIKCGEGKD